MLAISPMPRLARISSSPANGNCQNPNADWKPDDADFADYSEGIEAPSRQLDSFLFFVNGLGTRWPPEVVPFSITARWRFATFMLTAQIREIRVIRSNPR